MATYESLTQEEKNLLAAHTNTQRATAGEQGRTNNHYQALDDAWNAQISAIVNSLDAGEVVSIDVWATLAGDGTLTVVLEAAD